MPRRLAASLTGLLCAVPCSVVAAPVVPSFQGLGHLPGGDFTISRGAAISGDGSAVVGETSSSSGGQAFLWTQGAGMIGLGDLPGGSTFSRASDVSSDGKVVVGSSGSSSGNEAFIWDTANGMRGLGDLPGGAFSSAATGVSNDGTVVAGVSTVGFDGQNAVAEAFIWDAANGIRGIGELPGGEDFSHGLDISGDGTRIVGMSGGEAGREAFLWDATGGMQGLGDLPGGNFFSRAWAISDDGATVVGRSNSGNGEEAFVWDAAAGMRGIGDLPGNNFSSIARAVSADGSTVVGEGNVVGFPVKEAFVWDEVHGMRSLEQILMDLGVDISGWELVDANAISADGRRIAGTGRNPDGDLEAFLAVIPEPATGLLVGAGLLALALRRRR